MILVMRVACAGSLIMIQIHGIIIWIPQELIQLQHGKFVGCELQAVSRYAKDELSVLVQMRVTVDASALKEGDVAGLCGVAGLLCRRLALPNIMEKYVKSLALDKKKMVYGYYGRNRC